ncbi:MAG: GNAT family N-acetyltransferase [Fimbriimonas sp.]|nr:GNAT family N-acetyltransferase [Fimbriimonas sp.]
MNSEHGEYQLDTSLERIQFGVVHGWLSSTYWSPGISLDRVIAAARKSSLVVGVFLGEVQVGYLRVVSDQTTFAWICDVFVDENHRGKGLAKAMVKLALADPNHEGLRRWVLATRDAHGVYADCGFVPLPMPDRWMARLSG